MTDSFRLQQEDEWRRMAQDLVNHGQPGDMGTTELIGYNYTISPFYPWFTLKDRKLKPAFVGKELQWYLEGDMHDPWIGEHAKVWKSVIDHDGRAVSNYGAEAFSWYGMDRLLKLLDMEPETRRAILYFGRNEYVQLHSTVKDQPCASSIHFMLRDGILHTVISQRSQDYIYGVAGDAVFFTMLTNLMASALEANHQADIIVQAGSFHHYPKHTQMVDWLQESDSSGHLEWLPWIEPDEARAIIRKGGRHKSPYTEWVRRLAWES